MVRVQLKGLVREFDDGSKIGPIELDIQDGELLTLLGPSGSGKTTTLRMIAGFIEADEGSLLFDESNMVGVLPRNRNIGMVFQSVALFPNMTVYQNIVFGLEMAEWTREETVRRAEELADLLGIRNLLFRKINEISGGEAQRVALARALAKEPALLLLDEPLSALDPQLRERLQAEIRRIQKKVKVTTIYVTHSQDEAFAISDRVAIINNGVIEQIGTPEVLYNNPSNEFVARFLGSGNIFRGKIIQNNEGNLLVQINASRIEFQGKGETGEQITFSVKPEDVRISTEKRKDWVKGDLLLITPQIGMFKVIISFDDMQIVTLITDEQLVKQLRQNGNNDIYFTFKSESVFVFQ